tara:strand:- start:29 stop:259 length:231 start_codon:yes stop_codon:yes gene_type:complete
MNKFQLQCAASLLRFNGIEIKADRLESWLTANRPRYCFTSDAEALAAVKRLRQRAREAGYFEHALPQIPMEPEFPF